MVRTVGKPLPIVDDKKRDRADSIALSGAQRLLDAGHVEDARAILVELAEDPSTPIRAHGCLLAAGVCLMCGAPQDALALLSRLPAQPAFAVDEGYRRMIEACSLRQLRRYDEALAAALASVEAGPSAGRLLVLADAQKHAGRVDDAARTLRSLLDREPDNVTALAQLAGYLNLLDDVDGADAMFAKFRAASTNDADAHRNAAFYFATRGDVDATVHALKSAVALDPDATRAYIADEIEFDRFRGAPSFLALRAVA
jgi:tetratricopeptide (TPR) repeat protein